MRSALTVKAWRPDLCQVELSELNGRTRNTVAVADLHVPNASVRVASDRELTDARGVDKVAGLTNATCDRSTWSEPTSVLVVRHVRTVPGEAGYLTTDRRWCR
jgi:hypothetical protein